MITPLADPWGDPLVLDWDRAWRYHRQRLGGRGLEQRAFRDEAEGFLARLDALIAGAAPSPDDDLESAALRLGLPAWFAPDPRAIDHAEALPGPTLLARIATDIAPSVGLDAPDRVLGPWADLLDPRRAPDRAALEMALAAACFVPVDDDRFGRTPFIQWVRRKPHPEMAIRDQVRAIERAPPTAWRIDAVTPEGLLLTELLGVAERARPKGPVVAAPASVQGGGAPGDLLLARVVRVGDGWIAPVAFTLRGVPEPSLLRSWVRLAVWPRLLDHKATSLDELLRLMPHALWRRAHEHAYARALQSGATR